jgi:quercetin dioxygenase-like cupin family protein
MIVFAKRFEFGKLNGSVYDFPEAGDILPMHTHDDATAHITIVAKGKMQITVNAVAQEYECGKVIDLPANQEHEFVALEPNSRIVNIQKNS